MAWQDPFQTLSERYPPAVCPALTRQRADWAERRPLQGLTILDATPLYSNTLLKLATLQAAGATVWVGTGRTLPHDPALPARLADYGLHLATPVRLAEGFDMVLDCAGDFADVPVRLGRAELTRTGAHRYASCAEPVYLADGGRIKTFETALGTGDGLMRGLATFGVTSLQGRNVVLFGCGKVGQGILFRLLKAGADVTVVDPALRPTPLVRIREPRRGIALSSTLAEAEVLITATGHKDALHGLFTPADLRADVLLANMGAEDEFGVDFPEERVLNHKAPINFALDDPTRMDYIDPTMALHNAAAERLLREPALAPGLNLPTAEDEAPILASLPEPLLEELRAFEVFRAELLAP